MSGDLTPQQAYATSARVVYDIKGDTRLPLATLWVAQTHTAALAIAELATTGSRNGGSVLASVVLELLPEVVLTGGSSGGTMSWNGWSTMLPLGESCPDSTTDFCRQAPGTGPASSPINWSSEWVTRDGIWGMAMRLSAPLDGSPHGGTIGGVSFAVAARTSEGQPLVVVADADQATVDAWADNPPSG